MAVKFFGCQLAKVTKFNENVMLYFLGLKSSAWSNSLNIHITLEIAASVKFLPLNLAIKLSDNLTLPAKPQNHRLGMFFFFIYKKVFLHTDQHPAVILLPNTSANNTSLIFLCNINPMKVILPE